MGKPTEEMIKRYVDRLIGHLREMRREHLVKLLGGEYGVRSLVKQLLIRMQFADVEDPEIYDWRVLAGIVEDFVSKDASPEENRKSLLRGLGDKTILKAMHADVIYLPPTPDEQAEEVRARLQAEVVERLKELLKTEDVEEVRRLIMDVQPKLVRGSEYYQKWMEAFRKYEEESGKVRRLRAQLSSLRKRLEEAERGKAPRETLQRYQVSLAEVMKKLEESEAERKRLEEELRKLYSQLEEFRRKISEAPPTEVTVRFLMDFEETFIVEGRTEVVRGREGEVVKIPKKLYDEIKRLIDARKVPRFIELYEPKAIALSDEDYQRLWRYFEEVLVKKFRLTYRHVWIYKDEFEKTVDRGRSYKENLKLVDRLLANIARETLAVSPTRARETVERKPRWAEPEEVEVRPTVVIPPLRPPPKVEIPSEPIEPMPFPRRLASSEIKIFESEFKRRLIEAGYNPEDYIDYWIAFRDAWHSSWKDVLLRFRMLIRDIEEGRPPPVYPRPLPPWKEIPRDPILHLLCRERYKSMEELLEELEKYDVVVTADEVRRIVKEEWKKGVNMSTWLKVTSKEYVERILGVKLEDC